MLDYIRGLIQPLNNRYYNGTRRSLLRFCLDSISIVGLLVFMAIVVHWLFWLVLLLYVALASAYFIYLDPHVDKYFWKHGWRYLYGPSDTPQDEEQKLMREYSKHPSDKNRQALEDFFIKKR